MSATFSAHPAGPGPAQAGGAGLGLHSAAARGLCSSTGIGRGLGADQGGSQRSLQCRVHSLQEAAQTSQQNRTSGAHP